MEGRREGGTREREGGTDERKGHMGGRMVCDSNYEVGAYGMESVLNREVLL